MTQREPELRWADRRHHRRSAGIGLETARLAKAHGAEVILAARNPDRLSTRPNRSTHGSTAAFDVTDPAAVERFFNEPQRRLTM